MKFTDTANYLKGSYGEKLVYRELLSKDYILYPPQGGAHLVDAIMHDHNKEGMQAIEVKSYRRRASYSDTGIDEIDYTRYMNIITGYNMPVTLYYVDDFEECIYYADLEKLGEGQRIVDNSRDSRYWHLGRFTFLRGLELDELRCLPYNGKYDYSRTTKFFRKELSTYRKLNTNSSQLSLF